MAGVIIALFLCVFGITFIFGTSDYGRNTFKFGAIMEKGGDLDNKKYNIIFAIIGVIFLIAGVVLFIMALN